MEKDAKHNAEEENEGDGDLVRTGGPGHEISANDSKELAPRGSSESPSENTEHVLELKLSMTLSRKIKHKALLEGVTVEELAGELISEGLVLRAWEIMERKSAMRQSGGGGGNTNSYGHSNNRGSVKQGGRNSSQQSQGRGPRGGNSSAGSFQNGGHHKGPSGRRGQNSQNILDDSANFLEYVRAQEKRNSKP